MIREKLSRPLPPGAGPGVVLGSAAIVFLALQFLTGALLAVYYVPTWDGAHESVVRIGKEIPFGWLVRSVHVWSAHLFVGTVLLHLARVFLRGAYEPPRRATWWAGAALLLLALAAAFTGQVLPLDPEGLGGANVAGSFADSVGLGRLVRGGAEVGPDTVGRMYAAHLLVIPFLLATLIAMHLALVARHRLKGAESAEGESPAFLRILVPAVFGAVGLAVTLAFLLPTPVERTATKPLWVFLPLYQALRIAPSWAEPALPAIPIAFLAAVPFLRSRKTALSAGALLLAAALVLGFLGWRA